MSKGGFFGEAFEMIAEEVGQAKKAVVSQVTGKQGQKPTTPKSSQPQKANQTQGDQGKGVPSETMAGNAQQDDPTKSFVRDLYGGSSEISQAEREKREIEDKQRLEALRQRFHSEYYERLTAPPKQQEPRPAEKLEQEKKEEEQKELEEKEKEPKDLPAMSTKDKGTKEKLRGVSG